MAKKKLPAEIAEYFRRQGARGGRIGGKRRLETMTAEERSASAKKASLAAAAARTAAAKERKRRKSERARIVAKASQ